MRVVGPFDYAIDDEGGIFLDVATDKALASAKVLLIMLRELIQLYPHDTLSDYV